MASLDLTQDVVTLTESLCNIESVSLNEAALADAIEAELAKLDHLEVVRDGNSLVARTNLGRDERIVLAGHIDTVPLTSEPANLPVKRAVQLVPTGHRCAGPELATFPATIHP